MLSESTAGQQDIVEVLRSRGSLLWNTLHDELKRAYTVRNLIWGIAKRSDRVQSGKFKNFLKRFLLNNMLANIIALISREQ